MSYVAALGAIFTIIFGLLAISQLDGLQTSLAGSITGPLGALVDSMGFILLLIIMVAIIGGIVAAFSRR